MRSSEVSYRTGFILSALVAFLCLELAHTTAHTPAETPVTGEPRCATVGRTRDEILGSEFAACRSRADLSVRIDRESIEGGQIRNGAQNIVEGAF